MLVEQNEMTLAGWGGVVSFCFSSVWVVVWVSVSAERVGEHVKPVVFLEVLGRRRQTTVGEERPCGPRHCRPKEHCASRCTQPVGGGGTLPEHAKQLLKNTQ
ncbi:hypothetical protein CAURIC_00710 [Corynebacterium auriscanis]|nr:hypothetical protein CAURIC_00710 [Corynebacterium auriscanis]